MLVLSRRTNETIVFPDLGITVEVIRVKGNTVRLGIEAPDSVRILRGELEPFATGFCEQPDVSNASLSGLAVPAPSVIA